MKITKKVLVLFLLTAMLLHMMPVAAFAETTQDPSGLDALSVEGTDDLGQLLADYSQQNTGEASGEYPGGYAIMDLKISNGIATVEYAAAEDATMVVALYTEDNLQLLSSTSVQVSSAKTVAEITLSGNVPKYFRVSAYLMSTADFVPLCDAYHSSLYTRDMQELLASTTDDYDAEKVINLDADNQTNFLVAGENTLVIRPQEGKNQVTAIDSANRTYTIENADETITALAEGDLFVYPQVNGGMLIVKVASIQINGTTAVIKGAELELEEVFSHIKIETTADASQLQVMEDSWETGLVYLGDQVPQPAPNAAGVLPASPFGDSGTVEIPVKEFWAPLDADGELGGDDASAEYEAESSISLGVVLTYDFYLAGSASYIELSAEGQLFFTCNFTGSLEKDFLSLGKWGYEPIPGVFIGLMPVVAIEMEVEAELTVGLATHVGFRYENGSFQDISTGPRLLADPNLEGSVFVGIDLKPCVKILDGTLSSDDEAIFEKLSSIFDAEATAMLGLFITGEMTGKIFEDGDLPLIPTEEEPADEIHSCYMCLSGNVSAGLKLAFELTISFKEIVSESETSLLLLYPLFDFYACVTCGGSHEMSGYGQCPERKFRISVEVLDDSGAIVPSATVTAVGLKEDENGQEQELPAVELGTTNENGVVEGYLPGGKYRLTAATANMEFSGEAAINGPGKICLAGGQTFYLPDNPGSTLTPEVLQQLVGDTTLVDSGSCGETATYELKVNADGLGVLFISGTGMITEKPWENADCDIHFLVINEGISGIDDWIFAHNTYLSSVSLPSTLTSIGERAFLNCSKLVSIDLPDGITEIKPYTFYSCSKLAEVDFPVSGMTRIGSNAFDGCSLTTVILPHGLETIESNAFSYCSKLTGIFIPNTVTSIGNQAFYYCPKLVQVDLYDAVTSLGSGAFENCKRLASVHLSSGLTALPDSLFKDCPALVDVNIPSGVTSLGTGVFENCSSLVSMTIPEGVTQIPNSLFRNCTLLETVNVPAYYTSIGNYAFENCENLAAISIPDSVSQIGSYAFSHCESLTSVKIPEAVTVISDHIFSQCTALESVNIPSQTTSIGSYAFAFCPFTTITIPDTVTSIGGGAFSNCVNLTGNFDLELTYLGSSAFSLCEKIESVRISGTLTSIGSYAFRECTALETVTMPDTVTSIDSYAFYHCYNLQDIDFPSNLKNIGQDAFNSCTTFENVILPDGLETIGSVAFGGCTNMSNLYLPDSVNSMGMSTFMSCYSLTSVKFPKSMTNVPNFCFSLCENLSSVELQEGLKFIYNHAFGETALTSIVIPSGVTKIGTSAFVECAALSAISLPVSLTTVDIGAFELCDNLSDVYYEGTEAQWNLISIDWQNKALEDATKHYNGMISVDTLMAETAAPADEIVIPTGPVVLERPADSLPETDPELTESSSEETVPEEIEEGEIEGSPEANVVYPGDLSQELINSFIVRTASFEGLVPGQDYTMLSVANMTIDNILDPSNVLYIAQVTAADDGTVEQRYIQRVDSSMAFVMLCGASSKDLNDATITFGEMYASEDAQVVHPTVVYNGQTLAEGLDYRINGTASYTSAGEYTCTIQGINDYRGSVACTYTVSEATSTNPFTDVPDDTWYTDAVLWAVEEGITTGTGDGTTFSPSNPCTRAHVVTFLWRSVGSPEPSGANPFTDVADGQWYTDAVLWAVEKGITSGKGDGTVFMPNATCSRAEVVTFLWRAAGKPTPTGANPFTDVPDGQWYTDAILWAVEKGITTGTGDGTTFSPENPCTRAHVVTFLYRSKN